MDLKNSYYVIIPEIFYLNYTILIDADSIMKLFMYFS